MHTLKRIWQRHRHGDGPFSHLFELPTDSDELVAIDCETTGLDVRRAELVSVAAVPISHGRVRAGAALNLHVQAPASLDATSIRIHRLRPVDLREGGDVRRVLEELLAFIDNRPLVGWCLSFDMAILNRYTKALFGFELPNRRIELSSLYQKRLRHRQPEQVADLRFEQVAADLGVPVMGRHSARGDATTAALMYTRLVEKG
ncbi:DNA polymerase III subunit epsilon [Alcanivorax balearicus MACL04]|uniref:DNA polymerase III subunit epsilon n=1 Tax=Alloalcanivorax balearicus MACL04 TaxID=1177182 RepID=A0ABT2QXX7_9GAMM|nr:3'-5' exonuclease [Alloalcanivorax balearicus]MCU5782373.1 DNA polymerase III subunit epsilon [Alloalcanivorax balearicus MACL04]